MKSLNYFLDNREIAILIWLGIIFTWAIFQKKIRNSFFAVFKAFTQKAIIYLSTLMVVYIIAIIYVMYRVNLWEISNLSDTIIWFFGVGIVLFININHTKEEHYFRNAIIDNFKLVVFIEFLVNLYVFNFWTELILVPSLAFIGAMLGVASARLDKKRKPFTDIIMTLIGAGFLGYALYNMMADIEGFASIQNLRKLLIPLILTIMFLPFVYLSGVYITYVLIFKRIKNILNDQKLEKYTKWHTVFSFHINLQALNRWERKIIISQLNSREDINQAIMCVKMSKV